jgi:hypothetical protein
MMFERKNCHPTQNFFVTVHANKPDALAVEQSVIATEHKLSH